MYGCLNGSLYTMSATVYTQTKTSDATGQIVRRWSYKSTIACHARAVSTASKSTGENWGQTYQYENIVRLKTQEKLHLDDRVSLIQDANGKILWEETDGPTVFDVTAIAPLSDPFGVFTEYEAILTRAEVQGL